MAADLKVSGRMTVKRLKENFKNEFGGTLRVYDGREKADDNATLASIRRNEDAKGGELVCNGHLTVGSFERRMRDIFGIKVQVATPDDWTLALDGITLSKLKDIPEKTSKADMEQFVAYKRKAKANDEVAEVEAETAVNSEEVVVTGNVELSDISKSAAIWVTFTTDEGDEVFYLDSLIKDGAKYSVEGIFEERFDVDIDDEQVAEMDCISDNILEDYDNVKDLTDQLFYEFYKFRRYEHSRGEASLANGDGYFVAIYIDGKKIYERNITTEFDHLFEDNSSDESLDGDIEKIKNRLSELGLTEFTFYTEDYCGELDDDLTDSLNSTIEADLHFQFNAGDESERYVAPRKVKIIDDELFFDLEEVEINYEYGPEVLSSYEGTTIEDILSDYWKSDVKKCLECMLEYMHNDDVVELNKGLEESADNEEESGNDDVWANFRHLTDEEIEYLNGKNIEVYIGPTNPEDDEDDYEYDSLDYSFADGEVSCGGGLVTCNLADIKIYDFSKDEDLKDKFDRLFDDDERFALNLVLNLINKHIEDEDFFSITNAVVDDLPIFIINMKYDNYNPIIEDCSPKLGLGYFQSVI